MRSCYSSEEGSSESNNSQKRIETTFANEWWDSSDIWLTCKRSAIAVSFVHLSEENQRNQVKASF